MFSALSNEDKFEGGKFNISFMADFFSEILTG